jgi:hypothetical protein
VGHETFYTTAAQVIPLLLVVTVFEARRPGRLSPYLWWSLAIRAAFTFVGLLACILALYYEEDWSIARFLAVVAIALQIAHIAVHAFPPRQQLGRKRSSG